MAKNNTDLNLFKVFVAIYQQRNLTRAAEALSVTQPAVSNALNRLRQNFNDKLFLRTHKGMLPTPFADSIIERVQEALQLLNSSLNSKDSFNPKTSKRRFRISMNDLLEARILPELIKALRTHAPEVQLDCFYIKRSEMERELAKGSVDLAFDATVNSTFSQLNTKQQNVSKYVCMLRKDHPQLKQGKLSLADYLNLEHIVISGRRKGLSYEDNVLKKLGHKRKIALRIPHYLAGPIIVSQSDLAITVPETLAGRHNNHIVELPFEIKPLTWNIYWHKSVDEDPAILWLRELVQGISAKIQ